MPGSSHVFARDCVKLSVWQWLVNVTDDRSQSCHTETTTKLARRMAPRAYAAGIEIALVDEWGM